MCQAIHIHIIQSLLSILLHVSPPEAGLFELQWMSTIKQLTTNICNNVPHALGEVNQHGHRLPAPLSGSSFRIYLQMFPLRSALVATQDSPECQKLVAEQLRYIGEVIGIGMANNMASLAATRGKQDSNFRQTFMNGNVTNH
ncbi:hypothetical protein CC78DRAFT_582867 [Lojkania enalia]|uniref:Uncharacterized protein n=1 Tax=Lojkania enalia TaxID=147567 RepID=A0A9P4K5E4_9PLEO|nr:hypothetical protein CC78DRAFT_582867 [Didymosphaeria enalia]